MIYRSSRARSRRRSDQLARGAALVGGLFLAGFGLWAAFDPRSFFDAVAPWPPFNRHFIHDIGAFQIGLGLALVLALLLPDALLVALGSAGVGQTVHALVHVADRDLGGKATDPLLMGLLAVLLVAGAIGRWRARGPRARS